MEAADERVQPERRHDVPQRAVRHHVVVGYDGTPRARAATARAIRLAQQEADSEIVVVCTHERPPDFSRAPFLLGHVDERQWFEEWRQQTDADLRHELTRIRLAGVDASAAACTLEDPVQLLEDVAADVGGELIVVPDDSGGVLHDLVLGSTVRRLKRTSKVPVVVVRDEE
jgi:nucleotide-binding universal stress UspA family protein